jgi:hypothetical protein
MNFTLFETLNLGWLSLLMPAIFSDSVPQCDAYLMRDPVPNTQVSKCVERVHTMPVVSKPKPPKTAGPPALPSDLYLKAWDIDLATVWQGDQLEGIDPLCANNSLRWNHPVTGFDLNKDGINDILVPISCYQGPDPAPDEKHNRSVVAAWLMFCSSNTGYYNCTQELFGTHTIRATGSNSMGGSPYTHVMATPADINGDGYPDFWYALNRDDGRPGFDFNDPRDLELLEKFCGLSDPNSDGEDCTRMAVQTVILSKVDHSGALSYEVVEIPWGHRNTQAMAKLPNHLGGYDLFAFNYGMWRVARVLSDNIVIDVSEEYADYINIDVAMLMQPYVHAFEHQGTHYLVTAEVAASVLQDPTAGVWQEIGPYDIFNNRGFTLWQWEPGVGFHLSDFFVPDPTDRFVYKTQQGPDSYTEMPGAFVRDIPVFFPRWHFFEFAQLKPGEDPVLVVVQEAGTLAGDYFGTLPDPAVIYTDNLEVPEDLSTHIVPISVIQGFYIKQGKLVARPQSVVQGDFAWNTPHFKFTDITGNGWMDMYTSSGLALNGKIFINNGAGTLQRVGITDALPDNNFGIGEHSLLVFPLSLSGAPYVDILFWGKGSDRQQPLTPPIGIIPGLVPITEFPIYSPEQANQALKQCQLKRMWIGSCNVN